jgi:hypothetical protein
MPLLVDKGRLVTKLYINYHRFIPVSFTRAVAVIDAKGSRRSKEVMLRAFRLEDRVVIALIYAATAEASYENFNLKLKAAGGSSNN